MPSEHIATIFRELGSRIGLAKLIDPDGIPDSLFGDFTELFFTLVRDADHGTWKLRRRGRIVPASKRGGS
ncbi:MAG: hypothetical protein M3Q30_16570 [Actinomycetota bacterium]|nr:hypothetical protein [Actinomycetota bacterium]